MLTTPSGFQPNNAVAAAYWQACLAELDALKPGNVGYHGSGHRMHVAEFVTSAAVSANWIGAVDLPVGERIRRAQTATALAVGCNTNLGIVLLAAPLAVASQRRYGEPLDSRLRVVLECLDRRDAQAAFAAIAAAAPAGLGASSEHDVHAGVMASLLAAMQAAADRDRIAFQYANGYTDIFDFGLGELRLAQRRFKNRWATTALFLSFLSRWLDTHVVRKHGAAIATAVRAEAAELFSRWCEAGPCPKVVQRLIEFDRGLKRDGVNPGTSADLTVATLFADRLLLLEPGA